jgi:hypothetical protein
MSDDKAGDDAGEKLVSLKLPKKARTSDSEPIKYAAPEYSYGTSLRLENHELKVLGIKALPRVGDKFSLDANVVVTSVHESSSVNNKGDRSITLQITDMAIE